MARRIDIVNDAQRLLGLKITGTFTDQTSQALDQAVTQLAELAFSSHWWRFATKSVPLVRAAENQPVYRYNYTTYAIPAGVVKIVDVYRRGLDGLEQVAYEHDADGIHAQTTSDLALKAIFAIPEDKWPIEFARYIAAMAAYEVSPRKSPEQLATLAAEVNRRRKIAEGADAEDGGRSRRAINADAWINSRSGAGYDDESYWRSRLPY